MGSRGARRAVFRGYPWDKVSLRRVEGNLLCLGLGVVCGALSLTLLLVRCHDIGVAPAMIDGEFAEGAELAARAETGGAECVGDHHALQGSEWLRDTLHALDALECSGPAGDLVGEHPTDDTHDHVGRGAVVERTLDGVGVHALGALHQELHLVTHEGAGDDDVLAPGEDNLLAEEGLLSNEGGQATKEVVTGINHDELLERHVPYS